MNASLSFSLQEEEIRRDEKLKYNCKCSFLEIYNEQITDLLDPSATNLLVSLFFTYVFHSFVSVISHYAILTLQLREDVKKGVYVENLSEFEVQTVSDILKLLTQVTILINTLGSRKLLSLSLTILYILVLNHCSFCAQGSLNRKVAATNMNRESSRSHSVFTCVIERRWEKDSATNLRFARLNLVDLAGSER